MSVKGDKLREQRTAELEAATKITEAAEAEDREITEEELEQVRTHTARAKELKTQADEADQAEQDRLQALAELQAERDADASAPAPTIRSPLDGQQRTRSQPNIIGGEGASSFGDFGEFLFAVKGAAGSDAQYARLERRLNAAVSGMGTTVDADGGFLVPPEFSARILQHMHDVGTVINLPFMHMPLGGNDLKIPAISETSRADGSRMGGVLGYWVGEASSPTASHPTVDQVELHLHKAGCLGYVTEELLEDATATGAFMETCFAEELLFKVEDAIIRGDGSKKPMGLKNAPCKIEVSAETSQTANTVWGPNIIKMWARRNARGGRNNVWLYNQDCEPFLLVATAEGRYGSASTSAEGVYLFDPPSARNGGVGTIMGRPAIACEYCDTVGDPGDLILFDPTQYVFATKRGGKTQLRIESSIHVRFAQDERTYRAFYRCDGQPWWSAALTPYQGTNTQSPIITLASR